MVGKMNKGNILVICIISGLWVLLSHYVAGPLLFWKQAAAAPLPVEAVNLQPPANPQYVSISALAFQPVQPNIAYTKDTQRQFLSLAGPNPGSSTFIVPLLLPDRSQLLALSVFGEDFDSQGEIRLRFKRCDHGQARCVTLVETSSTLNYAFGQFETAPVTVSNEVVDNRFYTYFLELELAALANSGLRSARLELAPQSVTPPIGNQERWTLAGDQRSFPIPNLDLAQVRICTDDLSHLNNVTHYPFVVIDRERTIPLSSNNCVTVWGRDIEIQRRLNTGPSSGTYQIIR
jgi:hypothetical protein